MSAAFDAFAPPPAEEAEGVATRGGGVLRGHGSPQGGRLRFPKGLRPKVFVLEGGKGHTAKGGVVRVFLRQAVRGQRFPRGKRQERASNSKHEHR